MLGYFDTHFTHVKTGKAHATPKTWISTGFTPLWEFFQPTFNNLFYNKGIIPARNSPGLATKTLVNQNFEDNTNNGASQNVGGIARIADSKKSLSQSNNTKHTNP